MANRVSQDADEVLYVTTAAQNRLSQEAVEVLQLIHIVANRVSQLAVEVLTTTPTSLVDRTAGLAKRLDLPAGYVVKWRAIDATGHDVSGVKVSSLSIFGTDLGG